MKRHERQSCHCDNDNHGDCRGSRQALAEGQPRVLPEGWRWVRLGEMCDLLPARTISTDGDTEVLAVTTACLSEAGFDPSGAKRARMWASAARDAMLSVGEVLIARSNTQELVGRAAIYEGDPPNAVASDLTIRVIPRPPLPPAFLAAYLSFLYTTGYWQPRAGGASGSMKKITRRQVAGLSIPLPAPAEQQRIASLLDEQMAAVACARAAAEAQVGAARALPAACIRSALRHISVDRLSIVPFGQLVDNFDGRRVPLKLDQRRARQGPYPYYGASGVIDHVDAYLFDGEYLLISEDGANLLLRSLPIAFRAIGKFWVNNHAHVVRPKPSVLLDYLLHFLSVTNLAALVTGAAQPKLTQHDLNRLPVPVPGLLVQERVTALIADQMAEADRLKVAAEAQVASAQALPTALLRRAFRGEV